MENASKALYMAAGILVSIMIVGIFVTLFRAGGQMGEHYEERQSQEQLQLFNSKFENFLRDNNTIIDMLSVTNLAVDTNEENEYNTQKTVAIDFEVSRGKIFSVSSKYGIERNYVYIGEAEDVTESFKNTPAKQIYAYDFLNKKVGELKDRRGTSLVGISLTPIDSKQIFPDHSLAMVDSEMVYKYQFKCTDIKYHKNSGRVKYMKFEMWQKY